MRQSTHTTAPPRRQMATAEELVIMQQALAFWAKFRRAPTLEDPIFFDPHSTEPAPMKPEDIALKVTPELAERGRTPDQIRAFLEHFGA